MVKTHGKKLPVYQMEDFLIWDQEAAGSSPARQKSRVDLSTSAGGAGMALRDRRYHG